MIRGTTPTHTFTLPMQASNLTECYITYAQDGETILEKDLEDLTQTGNTVSFTFTQAETLLFKTNVPTEIQLAVKMQGNVLRSEIMSIDTERILKDAEI